MLLISPSHLFAFLYKKESVSMGLKEGGEGLNEFNILATWFSRERKRERERQRLG